ncbi:DUF3597 domain-containing protein [Roseomonas sp. HJA6]|uniref:DUF3597 domain-containing protein n=1 Tax=Roseomonas alba TaxID=2846776 RepID=A0ABS7AG08_9PROT|nr:DUF3597 domain-containing protein [Neoroseomonas alba]MBW6401242.1 DUF3597 domain-containing protein [Neoroseomonas alba]
MSIFQSIMNGVFGRRGQGEPHAAPTGATGGPDYDNGPLSAAPDSAPDAPGHSSVKPASAGAADPNPLSAAPDSAPDAHRPQVDVAAVLSGMEAASGQKLDWRHSIVDLMKLLGIDSSLPARRELARELGYAASTDDTAAMNVWLHRQVMQKLAENGGRVPPDLMA